jgi:threo-3-hydroxy-L-aspartate ammonia-lyase
MLDLRDTPVLPAAGDVVRAAERLRGIVHRTPVLTSSTLNALAGSELHLKGECFQRTGSFKFRGAYHALVRLPAEERLRGVLAFSSGNHAQAVALAGRLLGSATLVVMPADAPAAKRAATEGYGAEVVTFDPRRESREEVAARLAAERGLTLIPPYDHADVVAGQGTAALELFEDVGPLDALYVPCGGGGLLSGSALAALHASPECRVVGVEPDLADDATRSFRTGTLHSTRNPPTIADGLRTPSLGRITFPLVLRHASAMITVSEEEIVAAMHFLWTRMKTVVEPSGAVALAGALRDAPRAPGRRIGVLLSGGNVDLSSACALLAPVGG